MRATRNLQATRRSSEKLRREAAVKKRKTVLRTAFWGVLLPVAAVAGFISALPKIWAFLHDPKVFPIHTLVVSGKLHYVQDDWLRETVREASKQGFFALDVRQLRNRICAQDWVAACQVQKTWPDKVVVDIVEHKPLALWGDHQLINANGAVFTLKGPAPVDLPKLSGPDDQIPRILAKYRELGAILGEHGLFLKSLAMNDREAWQFELGDGVSVHVGREDFDNRITRFLALYPRLKNDPKRYVDYIDLRYDTGVAVGWKAEPKITKDMDARIAALTTQESGH